MGLEQIRRHRKLVQKPWRGILGMVLALVLALLYSVTGLEAKTNAAPTTSATIALSDLPPQGQRVMQQIREGGPFRYEKDGTVFGNRERLLPLEKRGFYREYTVPTPGLSHRGARRIVCGGFKPQVPDACYYTEDHYSSFRLIVQPSP